MIRRLWRALNEYAQFRAECMSGALLARALIQIAEMDSQRRQEASIPA
jgi:hypothetical protein